MSSPRAVVSLVVRVEYDPRRGDPDSIASALDCLLMCEGDPLPELQDYGVESLGEFVPVPVELDPDAFPALPWGAW